MKKAMFVIAMALTFAACGSGESTAPVTTDSTTVDSTVVDSVKVAVDSAK
jgi:ABC-type glycerol-3-phosphate transport system substrate-binding protein